MQGGSWVALVTPMKNDGSIDWQSLEQLIEWHVVAGTDGLVIAGTTGECATLSTAEHMQLIGKAVELAKGRLPVAAGTGSNSTQEALALAQEAQSVGANAYLTVVPYYNKPTQEGLYRHFMTQADAVTIPQILYNVPGRTVADLHNDTVLRLAQHDNIVGLKDATGDLNRAFHLRGELGDQPFTLYSGDDMSALAYLKVGGDGCISVTANVMPAQVAQICQLAAGNHWQQASRIDAQIRPLHRDLFIESSPSPTKWILNAMGKIQCSQLRLPLVPPSAAAELVLKQLLPLVNNGNQAVAE